MNKIYWLALQAIGPIAKRPTPHVTSLRSPWEMGQTCGDYRVSQGSQVSIQPQYRHTHITANGLHYVRACFGYCRTK